MESPEEDMLRENPHKWNIKTYFYKKLWKFKTGKCFFFVLQLLYLFAYIVCLMLISLYGKYNAIPNMCSISESISYMIHCICMKLNKKWKPYLPHVCEITLWAEVSEHVRAFKINCITSLDKEHYKKKS